MQGQRKKLKSFLVWSASFDRERTGLVQENYWGSFSEIFYYLKKEAEEEVTNLLKIDSALECNMTFAICQKSFMIFESESVKKQARQGRMTLAYKSKMLYQDKI